MKATLHELRIRNFKAFPDFDLKLEGRHLLLYGANGSGKSSLYWALYTLLQSARKTSAEVSRYFDPSSPESLLNVHTDPVASPGQIVFTVRDAASGKQTAYGIGLGVHETKDEPTIGRADLASDFITYRFFFGFSNFRNSQRFDIWPIFEREILPFCMSTHGAGSTPQQVWETIKSGIPNPYGLVGGAASKAHRRFRRQTETFTAMLREVVDSISAEAQKFYASRFSLGDAAKIELKCGLVAPPTYDRSKKKFSPPVVEFGVVEDGRPIAKPQTFLNEAKLTQLALSVRLAASLINLQQSDLKLLVLDDLLISLDMDNRMRVVETLLSETFAGYQKIILTHNLGFFHEFRRTIGPSHPDWLFERLVGDPVKGVGHLTMKTERQKAEDYLSGHSLDEAALCLRRAVEGTVERYLNREVVPTKEFTSLTENLRAARNKILSKVPTQLYEQVLRGTPPRLREHLLAVDDRDVDVIAGLTDDEKQSIKMQRRKLRAALKSEHWKAIESAEVIDEVINATERVLNPAAHGGASPLYEREVRNALDLLARLDTCLI